MQECDVHAVDDRCAGGKANAQLCHDKRGITRAAPQRGFGAEACWAT